MLNNLYDVSLGLILETDIKLKESVLKFIDAIPEDMKNSIEEGEYNGEEVSNKNYWNCTDDGEDLCIAVGKNKRLSPKEYMSIQLHNVSPLRIKNMSKTNDDEYLGSVTFYLYDVNDNRVFSELDYNIYLERMNGRYYIHIRARVNSESKGIKELVEKNGLSDLAKSIKNKNLYEVDINKLISNIQSKPRK